MNENGQRILFPVHAMDLAGELGLDWWAAKKLFEDGWLSFDPETTVVQRVEQEAELRFLGGLVTAGCDPYVLKRLLAGLSKPYAYDLKQMYYDWYSQQWQARALETDPARAATVAIEQLADDGDLEALNAIAAAAQQALVEEGGEPMTCEPTPEVWYDMSEQGSAVPDAARQLLWKLAASPLVSRPSQVVAVGTMSSVFQRLPAVTYGVGLELVIRGPQRQFGEHTIFHYWELDLDSEGFLSVTARGYFHRPQTGGDSFTSMYWTVAPGKAPDYADLLDYVRIVDDAMPFDVEVEEMDLSASGYSLSVSGETMDSYPVETEDEEE